MALAQYAACKVRFNRTFRDGNIFAFRIPAGTEKIISRNEYERAVMSDPEGVELLEKYMRDPRLLKENKHE